MAEEELRYVVKAEDQFSRTLNKAKKETGQTDRRTNQLNKSMSRLKKTVGGLAIGAAFAGFGRHIAQTTNRVREFRRETSKLTDATGGQLDMIVSKAKSISDTYEKDYMEVIKSANTLAERFNMTQTQALENINKGFLQGGKSADDYLKQLREYGPAFKNAGFKAQEFFSVVAAGTKEGAFQDKMPDAIKEFSMAIREQTKPVQDALRNAFGKDVALEFKKGIEEGTLNAKGALIKLNKEIQNTNPNAQELQQLVADLFKGPGEDLGMDLIRNLDKMTQAMQDQEGQMDSLTKHQKMMQQRYEDLSSAQNRFVRNTQQFGNIYQKVWTGIQEKTFSVLDRINKAALQTMGYADQEDFGKAKGKREGAKIRAEIMKEAKQEAMSEDSKGGEKFTQKEVLDIATQKIAGRLRKIGNKHQGKISEQKSEVERMNERAKGVAGGVGLFNDLLMESVSGGYLDAGYFGSGENEREASKQQLGKLKGQREELTKFFKKMNLKKQEIENQVVSFDKGDGGDGDGEPSGTGGMNIEDTEQRADRLVSQAPDSINISIDKLIETINIISETLPEGTEQMKEPVLQAIMTAINQGQAAGNR